MVARVRLERSIRRALRRSPIVALLGPRQCGKTTMAREIAATAAKVAYFDLEDPVSASRLDAPMLALQELRGLVIIDEVQRRPDLFEILRVLADRPRRPARFLVLGSASFELVRHSSETLAGRVEFVEMAGFDLEEVGSTSLRRRWLRGGFPRSFLARNDADSLRWREDFIRTFLERDVRELGFNIPPVALRRLWMMIAHYHGQIWNGSEIGRSLGEAHTTVKRHLDILGGALVLRQLPPWFENLGKRQIKSPKVYVRDSGLLHALLGIPNRASLEGHPKVGASWEGLVVEEALRVAGERNSYFWGTQSGAELDVLLLVAGKRIGIEAKYADAPSFTKSMAIALQDLKLERLWVVYPGAESYWLGDRTEAIPLGELRAKLTKASPRA